MYMLSGHLIEVSERLYKAIKRYSEENDQTISRVVEDSFNTLLSVKNDPNLKGFKIKHYSQFYQCQVAPEDQGKTNDEGDPIEINQEEISDDDKKKLSTRMLKELGERWDDKPPIGILPRKIWEDNKEATRHQELKQAIVRYIEADKPIKQEWIDEYHDWFPKAPDNFMKPERKKIMAWYGGKYFLYEVDDINKKLNILTSIGVPNATLVKKDDFIKMMSGIDDSVNEHWFKREEGASGRAVAEYISNKLLPDKKCIFFSPRTSNHHDELERAYFDHHYPGFEIVKQQSNKQ